MTYDEFKKHLLEFMWKTNDAALAASLDTIILMTDAELSRKLITEAHDKVETLSFTDNAHDLTTLAIKRITNVTTIQSGVCMQTTKSQINAALLNNEDGVFGADRLYYYGEGLLYISGGASVTAPQDVVVTYRGGIPAYAVTDTSWVADDYLDLYTYAVIKHCAPFLREDERLAVWLNLYGDALNSAIEDNLFNDVYGGSPLHMNPARTAP